MECYYGEYKKGLFSKRQVVLRIYYTNIAGTGMDLLSDEFVECTFDVKLVDIEEIKIVEIKNVKCLYIKCIDTQLKSWYQVNRTTTIYFPNLENMEEVKRILCELRDEKVEEKTRREQKENERKEKQLLEQQKRKEECQQYFNSCYNFHIADNSNPYFELQNEELKFTAIYIDKGKNLNFLKIDGNSKEESNACIPYDKIHYFEKAGNVYYTSDISGNYSNYGGSFTGGTISKGATALRGMLFGTMGMVAGALLTYKPAKIEMPTSSLNISSEVHKIDDRSVILNYYSDVKQQFMDIELPANIYNFLQTHLPEKKYGIVVEIEKKNAVKMHENNNIFIEGEEPKCITQNDDIDEFEKRIKKLKIMYDNGILTEEEFMSEKKRILLEC